MMTNVSLNSPTARYSQTNTNTPPPLSLFVLISTPGPSLDPTLDLNRTTVCSGSDQTRTYTSTSRQRSTVPIVHLSLAPPSCSISGLDWTSQGPGASPPSVWLIPSLHHLFPSLASDTCVKGNTAAWWIGLFMDASRLVGYWYYNQHLCTCCSHRLLLFIPGQKDTWLQLKDRCPAQTIGNWNFKCDLVLSGTPGLHFRC